MTQKAPPGESEAFDRIRYSDVISGQRNQARLLPVAVTDVAGPIDAEQLLLVELFVFAAFADILNGKAEEWPHCQACGKHIRPRASYVHDAEDGLDFHARCVGIPAAKAMRMDTPAYYRREMVLRADTARAFLRERGLIA